MDLTTRILLGLLLLGVAVVGISRILKTKKVNEVHKVHKRYVLIFTNLKGLKDRYEVEALSTNSALTKFECDTGLCVEQISSINYTD